MFYPTRTKLANIAQHRLNAFAQLARLLLISDKFQSHKPNRAPALVISIESCGKVHIDTHAGYPPFNPSA